MTMEIMWDETWEFGQKMGMLVMDSDNMETWNPFPLTCIVLVTVT